MKEIPKIEPLPPDRVGRFLGAICTVFVKPKKYICCSEKGELWIMREVDNKQYGLNGLHQRRDEMVRLAQGYFKEIQFFEFDSKEELEKWSQETKTTIEDTTKPL